MSVPLPELQALYARREASPTEVIDRALARVERLDGTIGAFRRVFGDSARAAARRSTEALTRGEWHGPLHGVPIAVKELFDIEGEVVTGGSRALDGRVAIATAEAVRRLSAAGAIVLGLTKCDEMAMGLTTQGELGGTRNPWGLDRVPGGSSGGSAAAVATGCVSLALGSDTGGSTRIPAAFCGVVGFKPSYGGISVRGMLPLAPSFDHVGLLGETVDDVRLGLQIADDREAQPARGIRSLGSLRIGVVPCGVDPVLAPDVERRYAEAVSALVESGCESRPVTFTADDGVRAAFGAMMMAEAGFSHRCVLGTFPARAAQYGKALRQRLDAAGDLTLHDYLGAKALLDDFRARLESALRTADIIVSPVAAGSASSVASPDQVCHLGTERAFREIVMPFTIPQNIGGLPACSVPAGLDDRGMPVGIQLTGRRGDEQLVLAVAAALQERLSAPPWPGLAGSAVPRDPPTGSTLTNAHETLEQRQ